MNKPIKIKVNKPWVGRVAVRDRYVNQANLENRGLEIHCGNNTMTIPAEKVNDLIVAKSKVDFFDKFSNQRHFLFYYDWKPEVVKEDELTIEYLAKLGVF